MYSNGDFALSQYLPYTLVPFYPLFQERSGQRVERSQADWEVVQLRFFLLDTDLRLPPESSIDENQRGNL